MILDLVEMLSTADWRAQYPALRQKRTKPLKCSVVTIMSIPRVKPLFHRNLLPGKKYEAFRMELHRHEFRWWRHFWDKTPWG